MAAEQAKTDADIELTEMTTSLFDALAKAGQQAPQGSEIKDLIVIAGQVVGEFAKQRELRKKILEHEANVAERRREVAKAQRKVDEWNRNWAAACSGCWIGEIALPVIDTVREILFESPRLQTELTEFKNIDRRIRGMESDEEELLVESKRLTKARNLDTEGAAFEVAERIEAYIQSVLDTVSALDGKKQEQGRYKSEQRNLAAMHEQHTARKGEMVKVLGVEFLAEIELKLAEVKKRDALVESVANQQASIMRILGKCTLTEADDYHCHEPGT